MFFDESRVYEIVSRTGIKETRDIRDIIGKERKKWTKRFWIRKSEHVEM